MTGKLKFIYRNAAESESERILSRWTEVGHYVKGFSDNDDRVLTFRKDRVVCFLEGTEKLLRFPDAPAPPMPPSRRPASDSPRRLADDRPQILFTGFPKVQRSALEIKADAGGLKVCQTVTNNLAYLCAGPNAGPSKVEKARQQNAFILNEAQLHWLLETGELPEPDEIEY